MWQKGWTEERNLLVRVIVLLYWSVNRKGEKETIRRVEKSYSRYKKIWVQVLSVSLILM